LTEVWVPPKKEADKVAEDDDERDEEERRLDEFGDELDNQVRHRRTAPQ
jgi:hypothetical protein